MNRSQPKTQHKENPPKVGEKIRSSQAAKKTHILTVNLEEYFQAGALSQTVQRKHWERLETRLQTTVPLILERLEKASAQATFFVLGWTAEQHPELVQMILDKGHEVASRGFWHHGYREAPPEAFREELERTKEALEKAGVPIVHGFRSPRWITRDELWMLDVLGEEGYAYDASVNPILRRFANDPRFYSLHRHRLSTSDNSIMEVPISTVPFLGFRVAISGGNYWRQLPQFFLRRAMKRWSRTKDDPLVLYFSPWELDPEQPRIQGLSSFNRIRQYRNLEKTQKLLTESLERYSFVSIARYLGLPLEKRFDLPHSVEAPIEFVPREKTTIEEEVTPVSVVIPLYQEEPTISYLHRSLNELEARGKERYSFDFILVDDGSKDGTFEALQKEFGEKEGFQILKHPHNKGVAAAILTGLHAAKNEIVCSMDCDCSYDPALLLDMIPELQDADLVTASPYHPQGEVFNVPGWRLLLSKNLSRLYNLVLRARLHTYTSCFRVYRKSKVISLNPSHSDFLGIAEHLLLVIQKGGRVKEHPATLESRLLGVSKMKTIRTIFGHLKLLGRALFGTLGSPEKEREISSEFPPVPSEQKVPDLSREEEKVH
ncbi:MAG TPA: DUF3473 domain-containing protein [Planctomycetes bacterium]|nr:DUF3473 domain-containing protein [Planctomycetota bacterium]